MATVNKYGFIPHGVSEGATGTETEKTVSCKVSPEVWNRWKQTQQRLAAHGEVMLAVVVRNAFMEALKELEALAQQLEGSPFKGAQK